MVAECGLSPCHPLSCGLLVRLTEQEKLEFGGAEDGESPLGRPGDLVPQDLTW